jgi:nickel-dependent lactate racemase
MIQAHKALEAASHACKEDGTIILFAECGEGLGRNDFLTWFESENSRALAERLCENYQVNGQTAWSLFEKAEKSQVMIITELTESETDQMRLRKIDPAAIENYVRGSRGYILPFGARSMVREEI